MRFLGANQRLLHLPWVVLASATSAACALAAAARMTGADPLSSLVGPTRLGADLLFALLAITSVGSAAALVSGSGNAGCCLARVAVFAVVIILGTYVLLELALESASETIRLDLSPWLLAALPIFSLINVSSARRDSRGRATAQWRQAAGAAAVSLAGAIVLFAVTNELGAKGFLGQSLIVLLATVIPLLGLLTALAELAATGRALSGAGLLVVLGAAVPLVAMIVL